jgi:hypothetical protein
MHDVGMEKEIGFSCEKHQKSFSLLTQRQKQYVAAYMKTGSPTLVAKELKLSGSAKGVGKRLAQIAKEMGLSSIRELKPNKQATQSATASQLLQKIEKQRFRCALSGIKLIPETAQLDHIKPISEGGTNEIHNLQWLDRQINKAKGTMSQDEFIKMCKLVTLWNQ